MYYCYIYGYSDEPQFSETTNEDGEVTYSVTYTSAPIKMKISEDEMVNLFYKGTTVYISYDDEVGNTTEDVVVTQSYIDELGTIISADEEEKVVGANGTVTTQTVTHYSVDRTSYTEPIPQIVFSSVNVTIDSIAGNASFITSLNPTKTNYKLVAVVGWSISGVSTVVPFRLYIGSVSETLYIGLRNTTSTAVTDKTLTVYLMWQIDNLNLENLEEEGTQEELVGPSNIEEEVEDA